MDQELRDMLFMLLAGFGLGMGVIGGLVHAFGCGA